MNLPIQARLNLWYGGLLAAALLLFAGTVYGIMAQTLMSTLDSTLQVRVDQVEAAIDVQHGRIALGVIGDDVDPPYVPVAVRTVQGTLVGHQVPVAIRHWLQAGESIGPRGFRVLTVGDLRLEASTVRRGRRTLGEILAWQSLKTVNGAQTTLLIVFASAIPLLLLAAGFGGWLLARRALAPVSAITATASRITATDLDGRVPLGATRDELADLAATFNAMIDRLQAAVQRERRFTADASHELRSPLAVVRAEASLALERPRPVEEYRRVLAVIDEETEVMESLVAELLLLSRVESARAAGAEGIDLAEVVEIAVHDSARLAEALDVSIESSIEPNIRIQGTHALLVRAVRNLIENALRHSPAQATVLVKLTRRGPQGVIEVVDCGPGIDPAYHQRIFEPFFQIDAARTPGDSHGLGLAICRSIVEAHGGRVTLASEPAQGARFCISLPFLPSDSRP